MRERKTYNKCYENFEEFCTSVHQFFFKDISKMTQIFSAEYHLPKR